MKKGIVSFLVFAFLISALAYPVYAQDDSEQLNLSLVKVFGYSSGFSRIQEMQGTFALTASGPANLERVVFYIDGNVMAEVQQPPYRVQFQTESFDLGRHTIKAVGYTSGGQEISSREIQTNFVTAGEGLSAAGRIIIPILVIVFGAMGVATLLTAVSGRGRQPTPPGTERSYGVAGGAICSKCKRPFALRVLAINAGPFHRIDRCPECGKWGLQRRRSITELRAAERAELEREQASTPETSQSEEERLKRDLDLTRYHND
jgi:hypothetical protein